MDLAFGASLATIVGALIGWLLTERNYRLGAHGAVAQWRRDLRSWADDAIEALSAADHLTPEEAMAGSVEVNSCKRRLSSLADRGRLLLPNEQEDSVGTHKASAFRGWRHPALDPIVAAHRILGGNMSIGDFPDQATALYHVRREFVSIIRTLINPRTVNRGIARLATSACLERKKDTTWSGVLEDSTEVPPGAEGLFLIVMRRYAEEARGGRVDAASNV